MTLAPEHLGVRCSVIIPAHNEATLLPRCLTALAEQDGIRDYEVIVVANGCTDATAAVARGYRGVLPLLRVLELEEGDKIGALNAGDEVASGFPRIYLDADVVLSPDALPAMVDRLDRCEPCVAAPAVSFDLTGSSVAVRAFYDVFSDMPYVRDGLVGLGVYGLSAVGRARFTDFPPVIADDLFVQRCFAESERTTTDGRFTVLAPRSVRDLVRVRSRVSRGNLELARRPGAVPDVADTATSSAGSAVALARIAATRPWRVLAVLVYVGVTLASRLRARSTDDRWSRDESTRVVDLAVPTVPQVVLDGVALSALTQTEVVEHVMAALDEGRGGLIMTPNVDHMQKLRQGRKHHWIPREEIIGACDLLVADGMPLLWASRLQGQPLPERVTGSDLVWSLSAAAAERGRSVFLLGGAPGVGDRAAAAFAEVNPGLSVCGVVSPPMGFDQDPEQVDALAEEIARVRPDVVFVALGFPRQELLAKRLRRAAPHAWFLACGGALDMAAGDMHRAAGLTQRLGLEWMHRLVLEPRRLARRYLVEGMPYAVAMLARAGVRRFTTAT